MLFVIYLIFMQYHSLFCSLWIFQCFIDFINLEMEHCFQKIHATELLCVQYEQLQLTYRPEEGPSEETKISSDELEPPASDNAAVSNVEITPTPTPPTPPPPPQNNLETGDLLVNLKVLCFSNQVYVFAKFLFSFLSLNAPPPLFW